MPEIVNDINVTDRVSISVEGEATVDVNNRIVIPELLRKACGIKRYDKLKLLIERREHLGLENRIVIETVD